MDKPGRATRRQIDYIMINAKYRRAARKEQSNIYGHSNMGQNEQRRVQTAQIYYNAEEKYKTPTPPDTGGSLDTIYANYACAQKSSPNGTKDRRKKMNRGETGRKHDREQTKQD